MFFNLVDLWLLARRYGNPMTGQAALPCPGSVGEQPAALMDAFAMLDALEAKKD